MNKYTFRTECAIDSENVPALLELIGVEMLEEKTLKDSLCDAWEMGQFTFLSKTDDLEIMRRVLANAINYNEELFPDMHRCWQTLEKGSKPNNEWYL